MNTAYTHRTLTRIAALAFAATVASVAQAGPPVMHGELVFTEPAMPSGPSTVSRDDRQGRDARGQSSTAGSATTARRRTGLSTMRRVTAFPRITASTKTRAERKAETVHAIKAHQMLHAGEVI